MTTPIVVRCVGCDQVLGTHPLPPAARDHWRACTKHPAFLALRKQIAEWERLADLPKVDAARFMVAAALRKCAEEASALLSASPAASAHSDASLRGAVEALAADLESTGAPLHSVRAYKGPVMLDIAQRLRALLASSLPGEVAEMVAALEDVCYFAGRFPLEEPDATTERIREVGAEVGRKRAALLRALTGGRE